MYDQFNRRINYLRISVTDLCNLRCRYCMPKDGIPLKKHEDILSFEEIYEITKKAVEMGIDKVRLTGGEPLVKRGIISLVKMLAGIDGIKDFSMTTNAVLLARYARNLKEAGIQRLNISLDSMDPEKFREVTRGGNLRDVLDGIDAAIETGFDKIKLNCVVQNGPDEPDARSVGEFGREKDIEVRYILKMNLAEGRFAPVIGGDGGDCPKCNRLRLSADGRIFPCLLNDQSYSVRELGTEEAIRLALKNKPESGTHSDRTFYMIGG